MRLLYIVESSNGGTGRHVLDLIEGIAARGHQAHLVYGTTRATSDFTERLPGLPARVTRRAFRRAPHPLDAAETAWLKTYIRRHGPFDVVHGHSSKGGALARLAAFGTSASSIYTPHALVTLDPTLGAGKKRFYQAVEKVLGRMGDAIITLSEVEHRHAQDIGFNPARLHRVYNGLNPFMAVAQSVARATLGIPQDAFVIGFVGRLAPQKAPERLIPILQGLRGRGLKPVLVVVGDGPLEAPVRAEAAASGLTDIIWAGPCDGRRAMAAFDVLAVPSRYEGFPYIFLEALHQGVPLVSMEVGGAVDLIRDGDNGFIIEQGDLRGMTDAIAALMRSPSLLQRMKQGAYASSQRFTLDAMVENTLAVYAAAREQGNRALVGIQTASAQG